MLRRQCDTSLGQTMMLLVKEYALSSLTSLGVDVINTKVAMAAEWLRYGSSDITRHLHYTSISVERKRNKHTSDIDKFNNVVKVEMRNSSVQYVDGEFGIKLTINKRH